MKSKLASYLEGNSTSLNFFFFLPAGIIGGLALFLGLFELPSVFNGNQLSYLGIWALMVLTHISTNIATKFDVEASEWNQAFVVESKDQTLRMLIGVGLFAFTFLINFESLHGWIGVTKPLLQSFFVLGCYVLIVQAPWSSSAKLDAEKKESTKVFFENHTIEVKHINNEWKKKEVLNNVRLRNAIELANELSASGNYKDIRVITESGYREVSYSPSNVVFGTKIERLKL